RSHGAPRRGVSAASRAGIRRRRRVLVAPVSRTGQGNVSADSTGLAASTRVGVSAAARAGLRSSANAGRRPRVSRRDRRPLPSIAEGNVPCRRRADRHKLVTQFPLTCRPCVWLTEDLPSFRVRAMLSRSTSLSLSLFLAAGVGAQDFIHYSFESGCT